MADTPVKWDSSNENTVLLDLCDEIICMIFAKLNQLEILRIASTCQKFNELKYDPLFWNEINSEMMQYVDKDKSIINKFPLKKIILTDSSFIATRPIKLSELENMTSLRSLYLTNLCCKKNDGINDENINKLTNLEKLKIWNINGVIDDGLNFDFVLPKLKKFAFKRYQFSGMKLNDDKLMKMTNLVSLKLMNCNISDVGISKLTKLTSLQLISCPNITTEGIIQLHNLWKIFLGAGNIDYNVIIKMSSLKILIIYGTPGIFLNKLIKKPPGVVMFNMDEHTKLRFNNKVKESKKPNNMIFDMEEHNKLRFSDEAKELKKAGLSKYANLNLNF